MFEVVPKRSAVLTPREARTWVGATRRRIALKFRRGAPREAQRNHTATRRRISLKFRRGAPREALRNRTAPKILKTGQVGARGNASDVLIHVLIHSFNRILIKGVDEHQNMCFRLDLPSKNVGLRVGLARFSLHYVVQHIVFA